MDNPFIRTHCMLGRGHSRKKKKNSFVGMTSLDDNFIIAVCDYLWMYAQQVTMSDQKYLIQIRR